MHLYAHLSFTTYCVIILLRPVLNRTYSTKITRHTAGNLSLQRISIAITLIYYSILFLPWQYLYAFYYVNFLLIEAFYTVYLTHTYYTLSIYTFIYKYIKKYFYFNLLFLFSIAFI